MRFWTFQNKHTLDTILKEGVYYPDFIKNYDYSNMAPLAYNFIKRVYEDNNKILVKGLVFGITEYNSTPILSYDDYKKIVIESNSTGISSNDDNTYILELEIDENEYNLTSCQFFNFVNLIFTLDKEPQYTDLDKLKSVYINLFNCDNNFLDLVQSHIHYIDKSMIKGIYRSFSYNSYFEYEYSYGACPSLEYYREKLIDN